MAAIANQSNYTRNELACREKNFHVRIRQVVQEIITTTSLPKWFTDFLGFDINLRPPGGWEEWLDKHDYFCGGYKIVYTKKRTLIRNNSKPPPGYDMAISIERTSRAPSDPKIFDKLKEVIQKEPKTKDHLIFPTEQFLTKTWTVSLMSNCPGGELFDVIDTNMINMDMFRDLAKTLHTLHRYNIAVGDLKMENIMLCSCNCLAFIDLDASLYFTEGSGTRLVRRNIMKEALGKEFTNKKWGQPEDTPWGRNGDQHPKNFAKTPWFQPIMMIPGPWRKQDDIYISDWAALALILTYYIGINVENDSNGKENYWLRAWLESNNEDRNKGRKSKYGDVYYDKIAVRFNKKKNQHPVPGRTFLEDKVWFGKWASFDVYENALNFISNLFGIKIPNARFNKKGCIDNIAKLLTSLNIGVGVKIEARSGKVDKQTTGKDRGGRTRRKRKTLVRSLTSTKEDTPVRNSMSSTFTNVSQSFKEQLKF